MEANVTIIESWAEENDYREYFMVRHRALHDERVANRDVREVTHGAVTPSTLIVAPRTSATRATLGFGICPSFKEHSLSSPVPNP
jgi:hypothetical protein